MPVDVRAVAGRGEVPNVFGSHQVLKADCGEISLQGCLQLTPLGSSARWCWRRTCRGKSMCSGCLSSTLSFAISRWCSAVALSDATCKSRAIAGLQIPV